MSPPSGISPPAPTHSHPSRLLQSPHLSSRVIQQMPTGYLFTHVSVYVAILLSVCLTLSLFSQPLSISLISMSAYHYCSTVSTILLDSVYMC